MRNPILEALGRTATVEDGAKVVIKIGRQVLVGTTARDGYAETYYRANPERPEIQYGPAISTPFAETAEQALHQFAQQLVGPQPRPGAVARKKDMIRREARVTVDVA